MWFAAAAVCDGVSDAVSGVMLDDGAVQDAGCTRRRVYSYLSDSDHDDVDQRHDRRRRRSGEWRDDDDVMSSPSWVRSGSGSESDVPEETRPGRHDGGGGGAFSVYSRINDSAGLT